MKKIYLHYANNNNMGDMLNIDICQKLFGYKVRDTSIDLCNAIFIGSILEDLLNRKIFNNRLYSVKVWGTGFISDTQLTGFGRKLDVYAVRGYKTLEKIRKCKNAKIISETVGDPGLLASELVDISEKKYDLGIIPHYIDKEKIPQVALRSSAYTIIDVNDTPVECIKKISQCRKVISSSLHGLIISDSFGIPNARLALSPSLGEYKFNDYYSVFGGNAQNVLADKIIDNNSLEKIEKLYSISEKKVELIKKELYQSFPF